MKQYIGVIGANGDLGSQLVARLKEHNQDVTTFSRSAKNELSIDQMLATCDIVHVCAPVQAIADITPGKAIIVLHDSVMNTSREASLCHLNSSAAIVHMLMNDAGAVVIASDAPHHDMIRQHSIDIGLTPHSMTIDEHDYMIARSQAPLALLCKTLLPYLYTKSDQGLLTPSGQLLADTLRARELVWTDETIHSILHNPQLQTLLNDMQLLLDKNKELPE